ncbi:MAG: hypothetical protein MZV65_53890 [Chromatiales bacterium]|nr:hypothetical protein [Chromatiales bacterium]
MIVMKPRPAFELVSSNKIFDQRFSSELEITAFRIVQEALTNVARYAESDSVDVKITNFESIMHVEIHDRGKAFDMIFLPKTNPWDWRACVSVHLPWAAC